MILWLLSNFNPNYEYISDADTRSSGTSVNYHKQWFLNVESVFAYTSADVIRSIKKPSNFSSNYVVHPLKLVAKVKVQSFSDKTLRVKVEHVRFYSNGIEISLVDAHQILAADVLPGGSFGPDQDFKKFLEQPMLVYTKKGWIKTLIVSRNEPTGVTEMKKALASLLQMKNNHKKLQLIKKQAIRTVFEIPRYPMKVDIGNSKMLIIRILYERFFRNIFFYYHSVSSPFDRTFSFFFFKAFKYRTSHY